MQCEQKFSLWKENSTKNHHHNNHNDNYYNYNNKHNIYHNHNHHHHNYDHNRGCGLHDKEAGAVRALAGRHGRLLGLRCGGADTLLQ